VTSENGPSRPIRARDTDECAYEVEVYQADDGSIIDMWGGALIREPTAPTDPE
jgi:hypothetical protein